MELAVFELPLVDAAVSLVPLELAVPVDEVVLEESSQGSQAGMQ